MGTLDEMPTPERGSRAPLFLPPRGRRGSDAPIGTVEDRVLVLERSANAVRRSLLALLGGVATSIGVVLIWALNAREAVGDEKARLRHLERAVERLESIVFSSAPSRRRSYAPDLSAQPDPPARREPAP
jgi:hypothetical protein